MSSTVASAAQTTRSVLARGRSTLGIELVDARDRFIASDPGLFRLRKGLSATLAVGTTVFVELLVMTLCGLHGRAVVTPVMMGSMMAMTSSTSVRESSRRGTVRAMAAVPVAASLGLTVSTLAHPVHVLSLVLFVGFTFAAVWIRQFGPRWSTWGFICWQAYFFALFLGPSLSMVPWLVLAVFVSSAWVALLLTTVLHDSPAARLRRTVNALRARVRAAVTACLDLLNDPGDPRAERTLRRQLVRASAVALLLEAQIGQDRALPEGVPPARLRRWLIDLEISLEEVAGATRDLTESADDGVRPIEGMDKDSARLVRSVLRCLGMGHDDDAAAALEQLSDDSHRVRRLTWGASQMVRSVEAWTSGRILDPDAPLAADDDEDADDYERVVKLVGDNLPGTQALAKKAVGAAASPVWSEGHLAFATRQAIQAACAAALAVGLGELISPRRFYWAAIAAFLTFVGASTAAETAKRAVNRTVGTMLGLVVSVVVAWLTGDSLGWAVGIGLTCTFLAFYFQPLSYAVMIFFITVQLGQLYELLHTFTDDVMLLRLAETAVGAAAGILASFVILPVSTRGTAKVARQQLMRRMGELLDECSDVLWGVEADRDIATTMVQVADAARLTASARGQLLRPRYLGGASPGQQHLTVVLAACTSSVRSVAQSVLAHPGVVSPVAAAQCRALADECRRLAEVDTLLDPPRARSGQPSPADVVDALDGGSDAPTPPVLRRRIRRLAEALTLLTPRGRLS